ncbi:hypothetical protein [Helicobacter cinaedi]|nr:hypothetical protein [Helicobacter cinaedi]BBB21165.1 hypothetical protein HC081234_23420 [Helicobacter cinaedi]
MSLAYGREFLEFFSQSPKYILNLISSCIWGVIFGFNAFIK